MQKLKNLFNSEHKELWINAIWFIVFAGGGWALVTQVLWPFQKQEVRNHVDFVNKDPKWSVGILQDIKRIKEVVIGIFEYRDYRHQARRLEERHPTDRTTINMNYAVIFSQTHPNEAYVRWDRPLLPYGYETAVMQCRIDDVERYASHSNTYPDYDEVYYICESDSFYFDGYALTERNQFEENDSVLIEYLKYYQLSNRIYPVDDPLYYGYIGGQQDLIQLWLYNDSLFVK